MDFIDRELGMNTGVSIRDLTYTLQTGRAEMEERIAFTASGLQEIREKLIFYGEAKKIPAAFYQGNVVLNRRNIDFDIDAGQFLRRAESALKCKDLNGLAQLWVSGVTVGWNLLYKEERPRRISLPTYPFAKEKYWIGPQKGLLQNVKEVLEQVKNVLERIETATEPNKLVNPAKQSECAIESDNPTARPKEMINFDRNIPVRLSDSPKYEKIGSVVENIRKITASFLSYTPPDLPEIYLNFMELGMDSVTILSFKSGIEEEFNVEFPSVILYEYSTIEKLSAYILEIIQSDEMEIEQPKDLDDEDQKLGETHKEAGREDGGSDPVLKLLDTIIASEEAGFGNSEYTEDDLKAIIDKMGI